ncbi:hematopoietic death receptor isoform X1 [Halichoeres trimaculatus]|uniref:hematopoietic death receptor isoform X1 n=1 Tax=Halichoeres trimaculatus TaxID=147232 RepID=UPI003D9F8767
MCARGFGLFYKSMTKFPLFVVWMVLIWPPKPVRAFRLDHHCGGEEYLSGDICCPNCPAGHYLTSPCTTGGQRTRCEECDDGTYTEHSNHLPQCFRCTQCRSDQEVVRLCTHTQNTECQCKSGRFCAPDQACELCKTCSRCEKDEEMIRNCSSTANTECKKTQLNPGFTADKKSMAVTGILIAAACLGLVVLIVVWVWKRRTRGSSNQPVGLKKQRCHDSHLTEERGKTGTQRSSCSTLILSEQLVRTKPSSKDECKVLCESLNSSNSNSQQSLTCLSSPASPSSPPRASLMVLQSHRTVDKEFPKLVPVNGQESLRKCFEYFEEIDVDYHKRFFRQLGLPDNVIKSKEHLNYEDKIHELLTIWMEKAGKDASLNDLLRALLGINQRRTAETIKENAVHSGYYLCEY